MGWSIGKTAKQREREYHSMSNPATCSVCKHYTSAHGPCEGCKEMAHTAIGADLDRLAAWQGLARGKGETDSSHASIASEGGVIRLQRRLSLDSNDHGPGFEVSLKHPDKGAPLIVGFVVRRGGRWTYYDYRWRKIGDAMTRAGAIEYLVNLQPQKVLEKAFLDNG